MSALLVEGLTDSILLQYILLSFDLHQQSWCAIPIVVLDKTKILCGSGSLIQKCTSKLITNSWSKVTHFFPVIMTSVILKSVRLQLMFLYHSNGKMWSLQPDKQIYSMSSKWAMIFFYGFLWIGETTYQMQNGLIQEPSIDFQGYLDEFWPSRGD